MPERRKNEAGFPVLYAAHQRIVCRGTTLAADGSDAAIGRAAQKQKGRREAGLSLFRLSFAKLST
jgi:hypothetical protein